MAQRGKPEARKQVVRISAAPKPPLAESTLNLLILLILFVLPFILYRDYLTGAKMLFGSDFVGSGGYANRKFMADYLAKHGTFAGWLPFIYSGLPTYAAIFGDIFYPLSVLLRLVMPVHIAWTYTFILQTFLGGLGMYLFLRELKVPVTAAGLLALAFMFSGSLVSATHEGHDGRLIVTSLFPLVMYFLEKGLNSRKLIFFMLSGAMMGMQLLSGHLQEVYYTGLIVIIYFLWRAISDYAVDRDAGKLARLVGCMVVMLGFTTCLVAIQYLPIYGNMSNGVRGANKGWEFATSWAMPPEETFDLITPRFSGGLVSYWGQNPFKSHTEYLGILPLILALFGIIFTWREKLTKFLTALLAFTLLMAWGGHTPFYYIPYYLFPGVAKFRAAALIFFACAFSIVALAGIGLKSLFGELKEPKKVTRYLLWYGGVAIGLLLVFAVGQGAIVSMLAGISHSDPNRISANYPNFLNGMLIAVVLILVNAALLYFMAQRKLKPLVFAGIAGLVLIFDTWIVDSKYILPAPPPSEQFAADDVVSTLQKDTSQFRVYPLYYADQNSNKADEGLLQLHGIQSIGGQHPNPLQHYMDFIGLPKTVMFSFPPNLQNRRYLDLLNCKYVISVPLPDDLSKIPQQSRQTAQMLKQYVTQPGLTMTYYSQQNAIYRNDSVMPRAWLVEDYEVAKDMEAVGARLKDPRFDPHRTVLLSEDPGVPHASLPSPLRGAGGGEGDAAVGSDSLETRNSERSVAQPPLGSAAVTSWDADRVVVDAKLSNPGFLVLSENWHPDWQATDNGKPVKILRAFETLRAIRLDAGTHSVEFRYKSRYFRYGRMLTLFGVLALLVVGLATLLIGRGPAAPPGPTKTEAKSGIAQP